MSPQAAARERRWTRLDASGWDAAVAQSPCATPFHSRAWNEHVASCDARFEACAWRLEGDSASELVLAGVRRRGAFRRGPFGRFVASQPGVYGGPLARSGALGLQGWRAFVDSLPRAPFGKLACFGNPHDPLPQELLASMPAKHFVSAERSTLWVELEKLPEDALESYESNCRRNTRKALREGIRVSRVTDAAGAREYHTIYLDSLRRWGSDGERAYGPEWFVSALERTGMELWCAREPGGRMAAGGLFLFGARHVVYWHGAMLEELAPLRPANALHHTLIEESRRRGARFYDFNPSAGLAGVEAFKAGFGPKSVSFPTFEWRGGLASWLRGSARA